jgi:hypothetical protein
VAFSPGGECVFGWDRGGKVLAWTVADGKPIEVRNPPPQPSTGPVAISPDASLRAEAFYYGIVLVDTEAARRHHEERLALEPINRLFWHQQQAAQAEKDNSWFAAAFHLNQLLKDKPDDPELLLRRNTALERLKPPTPMQPLPPP